jgi:uncharacterized membrane protein YedE/YeeE
MENFTPVPALIGGALIGLSATLLFLFNGRLAGISGIAGGLLSFARGDMLWRVVFLAGLIVGTLLYQVAEPATAAITITDSVPVLIAGGLIAGFGTRLGGGCTSGHGVCGISIISGRSIVATLSFVASAMATVAVVRHGLGG